MQPVRFPALDGYSLGATLYRPQAANTAAVVVHAAAGVRQGYYAKFAAYLAGRGFTVLTFDYRGIGESRPPHLAGFEARMRDWAALDAAGALAYLQQRSTGHACVRSWATVSAGNASPSCRVPSATPARWRWLRKAATGATGRAIGRAGMWLATHAVLPGAVGHPWLLPGAPVWDKARTLPAGVATEWARWCRHPGYIVGALGEEERYAAFRSPLRVVWIVG